MKMQNRRDERNEETGYGRQRRKWEGELGTGVLGNFSFKATYSCQIDSLPERIALLKGPECHSKIPTYRGGLMMTVSKHSQLHFRLCEPPFPKMHKRDPECK